MKKDKIELSGLVMLFFGIGLLAFTFFSAYAFLVGGLSIQGSQNLVGVFGQALAPLFEAVIRILYLGVMGWIGSILTIRALQVLKMERTEAPMVQQPAAKAETKQMARQEPKHEVKETRKVENPENLEEVKKPKEDAQAQPSQSTPLY